MNKGRPAKVGTIPMQVVTYGYNKIEVGKKIKYRLARTGSKWEQGIVTRINSDGYIFLDKL